MISHERRDIEDILGSAAAAIDKAMRDISAKYLEAAEAAASIKKCKDWDALLPLLASRSNLKLEDLVVLQKVAEAFKGGDGHARTAALSVDAIRAVADAPEELQRDALSTVGKGHRIHVSELAKLVQRRMKDSPADVAEQSRSAYLEAVAWQRVESLVEELQEAVDAIVSLVCDFVRTYVDDDELLNVDKGPTSGFHEAVAVIGGSAAAALSMLDRVFGRGRPCPQDYDREAVMLLNARSALDLLASGEFRELASIDNLMADLEYLSSEAFHADSRLVERPLSPPPRLKVLELCAGAGGTALGLMAAGFEHACLVEKRRNPVDTLRKNWPAWPVRQADVRTLGPDDLKDFHEIDLVAAGLPCGPGEKREDADDLYPEMARIIAEVRPKAFLLEHDAGSRQDADYPERGKNLWGLRKLKYDVVEFELDTMQFGVPCSRRRYFVVGIRSDISGIFIIPKVAGGDDLAKNNAGAFSKLIAPYETSAASRRNKSNSQEKNPQQDAYDRWASHWKAEHGRRLLPSTLAKEEERQPESWSHAGFRISEVANAPPSILEVAAWRPSASRGAVGHFMPAITFDILAAAQGFPPGWTFSGGKAGKLDQIQAALPPALARMVGLMIRTTLTGETFDLQAELRTEILNPKLVGTGPRRLKRSKAFHQSDLFNQIERLLDGEALGTIEPVRSRRPRLKQLAAEIRAAQAELEKNPGRPRTSRFI